MSDKNISIHTSIPKLTLAHLYDAAQASGESLIQDNPAKGKLARWAIMAAINQYGSFLNKPSAAACQFAELDRQSLSRPQQARPAAAPAKQPFAHLFEQLKDVLPRSAREVPGPDGRPMDLLPSIQELVTDAATDGSLETLQVFLESRSQMAENPIEKEIYDRLFRISCGVD